ncbi:CIC_collapsed_G0027240.mRNA.1.CDS.1 [Saccharomyces cerevisiae]|nr:CIC_collapsed_G0027240.mRNA.1.CDS.1 [Saccharomyces cerevisiae]
MVAGFIATWSALCLIVGGKKSFSALRLEELGRWCYPRFHWPTQSFMANGSLLPDSSDAYIY